MFEEGQLYAPVTQGADGSVEVQLQRPDVQHWSIQVSDTGPGMPPEVQA